MLRVGVIGTGVMGAEHARLLREETAGACLAAVSDIAADRAAEVAKGAAVFTDAAAMIADANVDAIVVASPDATHAGYAKACIAAGKPVLCEKPMAATAIEAFEVVEAETASGKKLVTVGFMRRFDPGYGTMRSTLASGQIGAAVVLHNIHRNASAPDWFIGAMAVTNSFVHEIDISRFLLDDEMVSAEVLVAPGGDPLMITMQTAGGCIVSTEVHMNATYGYHVHAQLVGREGTIEMSAPTRTALNLAGHGGLSYPKNWVPRFAEAYRIQMQSWVDAIRDGRQVGANAWDGYVTTAIAEQVVGALAAGSRTSLSIPKKPTFYM